VSIAKGANAASDASTTDKNNGDSLVIDLIYVSTFKNQTFNKKSASEYSLAHSFNHKITASRNYGSAWNSLTRSSISPAIIAFEFLSLRKIIGCAAITGLRESSIALVMT
jgi:hypothetical protein